MSSGATTPFETWLEPPSAAFARAGAATRTDEQKLARLRVHLTYLWRHRRKARLDNPQLFTELIQARKLFDRNAAMPPLADKLLAKDHVARALGSQWVIPTLWHGTELPERQRWPAPFVVKARHGCNQRAFIRSARDDWQAVRESAQGWMRHRYGYWLDEWLYSRIEKGLLIEPFMGSNGQLPLDYKFYVFGGRVEYVQVHIDREYRHRWVIFDRVWKRVSRATGDADPAPPLSLRAMIEAAEQLGRQFDFVRADFYQIGRTPMFGELTFYPGSGLDPFDPPSLDAEMGARWHAAKVSAE